MTAAFWSIMLLLHNQQAMMERATKLCLGVITLGLYVNAGAYVLRPALAAATDDANIEKVIAFMCPKGLHYGECIEAAHQRLAVHRPLDEKFWRSFQSNGDIAVVPEPRN